MKSKRGKIPEKFAATTTNKDRSASGSLLKKGSLSQDNEDPTLQLISIGQPYVKSKPKLDGRMSDLPGLMLETPASDEEIFYAKDNGTTTIPDTLRLQIA